MSNSGELTAAEYLSDILEWRNVQKQSSLPNEKKLSERSSGEILARER
jgi:hypothetical protein